MVACGRLVAGAVRAAEGLERAAVDSVLVSGAEEAGARLLEATRSPITATVESTTTIATGARRTFDGTTAIPDVLRPTLPANSLFDAQRFTEIGENYRDDVARLRKLPSTIIAEPRSDAGSIAGLLLNQRAALTRERVTPQNTDQEIARLLGLNPALKDVSDWGGHHVTAYTDETMRGIAADALLFKHVPPLGQFLKATGKVTEDQIQDALAHQSTLPKDAPRRFLGQILEDRGIITASDADRAEDTQKALRRYLRTVLENSMKQS